MMIDIRSTRSVHMYGQGQLDVFINGYFDKHGSQDMVIDGFICRYGLLDMFISGCIRSWSSGHGCQHLNRQ